MKVVTKMMVNNLEVVFFFIFVSFFNLFFVEVGSSC